MASAILGHLPISLSLHPCLLLSSKVLVAAEYTSGTKKSTNGTEKVFYSLHSIQLDLISLLLLCTK